MFPGSFRATVEQSFSPPCISARNRGGRSTPFLPLPLPVARLCIFHQVYRPIGERRTDLSCPCVVRCRSCFQLSCDSLVHCDTRFHNLQECGINSRYGLYSCIAPVGNRGKGETSSLGKKDVSHAPLLS